jgi:hypothetical protein
MTNGSFFAGNIRNERFRHLYQGLPNATAITGKREPNLTDLKNSLRLLPVETVDWQRETPAQIDLIQERQLIEFLSECGD